MTVHREFISNSPGILYKVVRTWREVDSRPALVYTGNSWFREGYYLTVNPVPWKGREVLLVFLALIGVNWFFSVMFKETAAAPSIQFFMAAASLQAFTVIGLVVYFVRSRYRLSWTYLGLTSVPVSRVLAAGLGGGLLLFFSVSLMSLLMNWLIPQPVEPQPYVEIFLTAQNGWQILGVVLIGSLIAPLCEEIYFRGFLYPYFRERLGVDFGLWASAIIFGALHLDLIRFVPLTLGGYGLALIYQRTGSLWASIIAHGVWNGIMTLLVYWSARAGFM
jgi:membrane protease YdiL (CAAX protease family)